MTKTEIASPESRAAAKTSVVILALPVSAMTTRRHTIILGPPGEMAPV